MITIIAYVFLALACIVILLAVLCACIMAGSMSEAEEKREEATK